MCACRVTCAHLLCQLLVCDNGTLCICVARTSAFICHASSSLLSSSRSFSCAAEWRSRCVWFVALLVLALFFFSRGLRCDPVPGSLRVE